ncbi:MAG TPA: sigma-70 family RNA polymerase sigma factor [Candidatus Saccharimonadales bacterium]|jgi:RNA polymerase sigma-70 factor (ECF subfamily)|nr:sigma-70 family RNA polymerase sigma factor [Candidatus Saccharimonadales bacterium]
MDYSKLASEDLVAECTREGKPEAWKEFIHRFGPLIAGVVARTARRYNQLNTLVVDDLVQETYLRLCTGDWRRLREFQGYREGAVCAFIKTVARTVTLDHFKYQHAGKRGLSMHSGADFDLVLRRASKDGALDERILAEEIGERARRIAETPRDRRIFVLHYRHGMTTRAIAEIPEMQLSQKGVESCLRRLTRQLQQELAGPAGTVTADKNKAS